MLPMAAEDIATVLTQLVLNAAEHGATEVTLLATPQRLAITDNGPGSSAGNRDRVFDPFFTTKPVGAGTGLGLSISHEIVVEKHKGTIDCVPGINGGTCFNIVIPHKQFVEEPPVFDKETSAERLPDMPSAMLSGTTNECSEQST